MARSRAISTLCLSATAILTVLSMILRTVAMLTQFDTTVGYYNQTFLITIATAISYAVVFEIIVLALLIPRNTLPTGLDDRMRAPFAILFGIVLTAFTVLSFVFCYASRVSNLILAPMVLGLLSATYFFITPTRTGRYSDATVALGYLPVLWCIATVAETYLDQRVTMNSPIKIALQFGALGLTLLLMAEIRFRLGKAAPRLSMAYMCLGVYFTLTGSLPILVGTAAGILSGSLPMLYAMVLLAGGLYGAVMLSRYILSIPAAESEDETLGEDTAGDAGEDAGDMVGDADEGTDDSPATDESTPGSQEASPSDPTL